MSRYSIIFSVIFLTTITFFACEKEEETIDCTGSTPSYKTDVKPIINANCLTSGCHEAGSKNGDYTTYEGLKKVATNGALETRVIIDKSMPPAGKLSLEDRKKIKCWISSGAPNN